MKDSWSIVHKMFTPEESWPLLTLRPATLRGENREIGQSLLEVLVAMAVAILVVGGLVLVVIVAVKNASFAKNQALATKYAQGEMENVRSLRDTNWDTFWSRADTTVGPTPISGTIFSKIISYTDISGGTNDKMSVTVMVTWTDAGGPHKSELTSFFTKPALWR